MPAVKQAERAVVILRLRAQDSVGSSFIAVVERYSQQLKARGGKLMLAGVHPKIKGQLDRTGTTDEILGAENVFEATTTVGASTRAAYAAAQLWLQETQIESGRSGGKIMSEVQAAPLRQQIDDKVIDVRNEVIMQATNAFLLGRQVVLVSLGLAALTVEQSHALLQQAVTRGEVVESDAQQVIEDLRRQLAEGTTSHISSGLAGLLNKLPGVNIAYKASDAPAPNAGDATPSA